MPVDLFGQPADYRAIEPIVRREGLKCCATRRKPSAHVSMER